MIEFPACMVFETQVLWCIQQKVKCHECKAFSKQVFVTDVSDSGAIKDF